MAGILVSSQSAITCPNCGRMKAETMPTDACQFFYTRTCCAETLRPKPGDCCVFCVPLGAAQGSFTLAEGFTAHLDWERPCLRIRSHRLDAGIAPTATIHQISHASV